MGLDDRRIKGHQGKAFQRFDTTGGNLGLTGFKDFAIHFNRDTIERLALTLVNRRGPGELEWNRLDCQVRIVLQRIVLDRAGLGHLRYRDFATIGKLDDGQPLARHDHLRIIALRMPQKGRFRIRVCGIREANDDAARAIAETAFNIQIECEHDLRIHFENDVLETEITHKTIKGLLEFRFFEIDGLECRHRLSNLFAQFVRHRRARQSFEVLVVDVVDVEVAALQNRRLDAEHRDVLADTGLEQSNVFRRENALAHAI